MGVSVARADFADRACEEAAVEKPQIQLRQNTLPSFRAKYYIPGPLLSPPYLSVYPSVYVRMRKTIAERRGPGFEARCGHARLLWDC